jgi:hypothetical protein
VEQVLLRYSTIVGRTVDALKGPLNPRTFGAIRAYDGHRASVGRVVVDATWHHFFNINLTGELGDPGPIKNLGFLATPAGQAAFADIKTYFRNIAVWLARPSNQSGMAWRALWWARWHHVLAMDLRPHFLEPTTMLAAEPSSCSGRISSIGTPRGVSNWSPNMCEAAPNRGLTSSSGWFTERRRLVAPGAQLVHPRRGGTTTTWPGGLSTREDVSPLRAARLAAPAGRRCHPGA